MIYYLQDNQHIFVVEAGKPAKRVGMITPKRGKPPAFKKNVAVEMPAEKALKHIKGTAGKSVRSGPASEPVKPVIPAAVLDMRPKAVSISPFQLELNRSKVFLDILDFQKKSQELHSRVLGLVKSGVELSTLPENVKDVLRALYMGSTVEIKDPPAAMKVDGPAVKQFDGEGILTLPAPEKPVVSTLRGKLY